MLREQSKPVDLLILGAGWTSTFLIPLLEQNQITYAATTTTGRNHTIPFTFDPEDNSPEIYHRLPPAHTILITFPLHSASATHSLLHHYRATHGPSNHWIQLGSTEIFNQPALPNPQQDWTTESSPHNPAHPRALAENALLALQGCVLNLAGLYGGASRVPHTWLGRVARSKEEVANRGAVHFVHGRDVARAVVRVHRGFTPGRRWIVTDLRVYDWWDLVLSWSGGRDDGDGDGDGGEGGGEGGGGKETTSRCAEWVVELMHEQGIRGLPRDTSVLGRKLDGRAFWKHHGMVPEMGRLA